MRWWLLSKPTASLDSTSVSNPIYALLLAKALLCGLCHIALTAVTGQCATEPLPDRSQQSADAGLGPGRRSEEGAQGCQSCLPVLSLRLCLCLHLCSSH